MKFLVTHDRENEDVYFEAFVGSGSNKYVEWDEKESKYTYLVVSAGGVEGSVHFKIDSPPGRECQGWFNADEVKLAMDKCFEFQEKFRETADTEFDPGKLAKFVTTIDITYNPDTQTWGLDKKDTK